MEAAIAALTCFASLLRYIKGVSHTPINELNDRTRNIFRMVVESYLDSGAPVGSRTISKFPGLNLSPASIRNVMQDLEEAGLLAAPHTSAGRMPTESGLQIVCRWHDAGGGAFGCGDGARLNRRLPTMAR